MAVHVHRAHRTDALADELARMLAAPSDDPFAEEVVVVPARGVERWLTQRLSHRLGGSPGQDDGVCAGVRFLSPRSLVALLTGTERTDPWDPDRLVWPLLATIDAHLDEPWCAALARHLGHLAQDDDGTPAAEVRRRQRRDRRFSVARRLAGLLARYASQRPAMLTAWRDGVDEDGHGHAVEDDLRWQPELYRRLVANVAVPPPDQRHAEVLTAIRAGEPLALPERLSLFGHTRLPATEVELLASVGEVREVHLWLPQASGALWEALSARVLDGPVARQDDHDVELVRHPLLASLGRDARELHRSLAVLRPASDDEVDGGTPAPPRPTLLSWLQHDLRADAEPGRELRATRRLLPDDASVQVHACHGPARQVDVLREVLVGMLEDDPTLEPRDVLVMCPDIESFAPLLEAGFGLAEVGAHPAHGLRVQLADRGLARTNPLLDLAARVVELAAGRATASQVLDLAGTDVVRRRFSFDDDDLAQLAVWVQHSGVRWGLAPDLRQPYALAELPHNTWQLGLDRLLLGVAMSEDDQRRFADTLPLDDVGSAAVDLAGRLAELVDRLETAVRAVRAATTTADAVTVLQTAVDALGAVPLDDAWQRTQVARELASVADAAAGQQVPLGLADVRALLAHRLEGRPTRASFRTGALTVATMVPMRSVPHRVICLVGLDDGTYPRTTGVDGDDALARRPRTGERDIRSEDRQLLLDAVLAATERLVITYTGADEVKGGTRPPAVPVGELLDALDQTSTGPVRDHVVVRHPLQPFDARNFRPGALAVAAPSTSFSFDRAAHAGARAARGERAPVPPFLPAPLPAAAAGDLTLAELQTFLAHPVRAFVRQRLGVSLPWEEDDPLDAIPVELDALQAWAVGDRIVQQVLAGAELGEVERAERSRGALPPLELGRRVLDEVRGKAVQVLDAGAAGLVEPPRTLDVTVELGSADDGRRRRLTGQVPDVRGERVVRIGYSRLGPKHRLAAWVDLLMLAASRPEVAWEADVVGSGGSAGPQRSRLGPVQQETALAVLAELVDLRDRGLRAPLPLPLKTANAWAETPGDDWTRGRAAERSWRTDRFPGEQDDDHHVLVWGAGLPLRPDTSLPVEQQRGLLQPADPDLSWNGQSTGLGQHALRLWGPLLDHERTGPA